MDSDELGGLSREQLLALVRRQREELAAREAAIERRDGKIRELEEELAQFRRPAKTPENSSVPPSRGQKANRAEGRRRKLGPKRGHPFAALRASWSVGCGASRTWWSSAARASVAAAAR